MVVKAGEHIMNLYEFQQLVWFNAGRYAGGKLISLHQSW